MNDSEKAVGYISSTISARSCFARFSAVVRIICFYAPVKCKPTSCSACVEKHHQAHLCQQKSTGCRKILKVRGILRRCFKVIEILITKMCIGGIPKIYLIYFVNILFSHFFLTEIYVSLQKYLHTIRHLFQRIYHHHHHLFASRCETASASKIV